MPAWTSRTWPPPTASIASCCCRRTPTPAPSACARACPATMPRGSASSSAIASARPDRPARLPRPVRPHARGQRHRLRRRDRRRCLPAAGPGRRGAPRRLGPRPDLDRSRQPGRRNRPPAGGGSVPVSVLALSGGVGGAKLALGLSRVLPPDGLTIVANTGDDFEHLGLSISPDIDTLV